MALRESKGLGRIERRAEHTTREETLGTEIKKGQTWQEGRFGKLYGNARCGGRKSGGREGVLNSL